MKKQDYLAELQPIVDQYRAKPYSFWLPYVAGEVIDFDVTADDGTQCGVEINAMWDDRPQSPAASCSR